MTWIKEAANRNNALMSNAGLSESAPGGIEKKIKVKSIIALARMIFQNRTRQSLVCATFSLACIGSEISFSLIAMIRFYLIFFSSIPPGALSIIQRMLISALLRLAAFFIHVNVFSPH